MKAMFGKKFLLMCVVFVAGSLSKAEAVSQYHVSSLGFLGGTKAYAYALNKHEQITGFATDISGNPHAFFYHDGYMQDLGTLNGIQSWGFDLNNSGTIVGTIHRTDGANAFIYENGDMKIIGSATDESGKAVAINDYGVAVGNRRVTGGHDSAFYYANGVVTDIHFSGVTSYCSDINNKGQAVGWYYVLIGSRVYKRPFYYENGAPTTLPIPDGPSCGAKSINENNQILMTTFDQPEQTGRTFVYDFLHDEFTEITTPGSTRVSGSHINNLGMVVGSFRDDATGTWAPYLYKDGTVYKLQDLLDDVSSGWTLGGHGIGEIDDLGNIVGYGYLDDVQHAILLTPAPEPTPPVADADGPYTIYVGDTLKLDASGSTDDGNDIVSYMWDLDDDGSFETDACGQAIFDVNYAYLESLELLINHIYTIHLKVTDSEGQSDVNDSTLTIVPKPALQVAVDIKPGSCPNPMNVKSSGVLPVAILGSEDVNVVDIVPTSIAFSFGEVSVGAIRNAYEDVAGPVSDANDCNCSEDEPDGYLDLTLKFKTQEVVEAIGDVNDGDVLTLELTGVLYDPIPFERPIEGTDCILIKGKYKAHNKADINKDGVVDFRDFAIFAENWLESSIVEE